MKFNEWPTLAMGDGVKEDVFFEAIKNDETKSKADRARAVMEMVWVSKKRPYYSVYPSIIEPLLKVKLDIPFSSIAWPIVNTPILIRIPYNFCPLASILASRFTDEKGFDKWIAGVLTVVDGKSYQYLGSMGNSRCAEDEISYVRDARPDWKGFEINNLENAWRLIIAVCMLAQDSEFVQPEVLSADAAVYSKTLNPKFVEKAAKRGKVGWSVGKHMESIPHMRRPHFAIRWTEKGHSVPKLVPVKGSVVKRKVLTDVPTGYMDDECQSTTT